MYFYIFEQDGLDIKALRLRREAGRDLRPRDAEMTQEGRSFLCSQIPPDCNAGILHEKDRPHCVTPDNDRLLRAAFLDYNSRAGLGLPREAAAAARVAYGTYGKPYFAEFPEVKFSISHSGRCWACLIGDAELGLDVEDAAMRRGQDERRKDASGARYVRIARRHFARDETAYVEAAEGAAECRERVLRIWTKKEAYVKYTGRGLGAGLSGFSVLKGDLGVQFAGFTVAGELEIACCREDSAAPLGMIRLALRDA
jgi:phosphopantetheinyl transferase (holo-ACP synthase)